jgi:ATP-binding cassette, subfamily B, bacterial
VLYSHVHTLYTGFFASDSTGGLVSRIMNDSLDASTVVTPTLVNIASSVLDFALVMGAIALIDWRLAALSLVVPLIFIPGVRFVAGRVTALTRRALQVRSDLVGHMTERLRPGVALLTRLSGAQSADVDEFHEQALSQNRIAVRALTLSWSLQVTIALVGGFAVAMTYLAGGRFVLGGTLTLGALIGVAVYVDRLFRPMSTLLTAGVDVRQALTAFDRLFELLDVPSALNEADGESAAITAGRIEFVGVQFRYPPATDVVPASLLGLQPVGGAHVSDGDEGTALRDVSLVVEPQEHVAFVGPTGSGKSTLVALIRGLHLPTEGRVRLDGVDVAAIPEHELASEVFIVPQDPVLLNASVKANLLLAKPTATDAELWDVIGRVELSQIRQWADGLDSVVGETGYRLSGGERQRLALGRALLRDPRILIVDEGTSQVDSVTARKLQAAVLEAAKGRTLILIAHRLNSLFGCSKIFVLHLGRIVETGTHEELMALSGMYSGLIAAGERENPRGGMI